MFRFARKTDYALAALVRLAEARTEDPGQAISARQIAEEMNLPASLLMNVLKDLHRAGLVRGIRGAQGGYRLTRGAGAIRLTEVLAVTEGEAALTPCCEPEVRRGEREAEGCRVGPDCAMRQPIRRLNDRLTSFLEEITLADLFTDYVAVSGSRMLGSGI